MIKINWHHYLITKIYILVLILSCGLFLRRIFNTYFITQPSVGEIFHNASYYTFGSIQDRKNEIIVTGSDNKKGIFHWKKSKAAFENLIGTNMTAETFSASTVIGHCPSLLGSSDRLNFQNLLQPYKKNQAGSVKLTIDSDLQEYIYKYMKQHNYNSNSYIVVSNYKTGELLATFGNVFKDRLSPGSTLKPIIAACALAIDPSLSSYTYNCEKSNHDFLTQNNQFLHVQCAGNTYHGRMNLKTAISYSCNGYFISLLQQLPKDKVLRALQQLGFDSSTTYDQFTFTDASYIGDKNSDQVDYLLACIGQANCRISPFQLNLLISCILNDGVLTTPTIFSEIKDASSSWKDATTNPNDTTYFSKTVTTEICEAMQDTCLHGTGKRFSMNNFIAKTGTAQTADDHQILWTTGGLTDKQTPLSITVCLANAPYNSSSSEAGLIARDLLHYYKQHIISPKERKK